jgi:hypothetical protein
MAQIGGEECTHIPKGKGGLALGSSGRRPVDTPNAHIIGIMLSYLYSPRLRSNPFNPIALHCWRAAPQCMDLAPGRCIRGTCASVAGMQVGRIGAGPGHISAPPRFLPSSSGLPWLAASPRFPTFPHSCPLIHIGSYHPCVQMDTLMGSGAWYPNGCRMPQAGRMHGIGQGAGLYVVGGRAVRPNNSGTIRVAHLRTVPHIVCRTLLNVYPTPLKRTAIMKKLDLPLLLILALSLVPLLLIRFF